VSCLHLKNSEYFHIRIVTSANDSCNARVKNQLIHLLMKNMHVVKMRH
jgi:hypothetical protein